MDHRSRQRLGRLIVAFLVALGSVGAASLAIVLGWIAPVAIRLDPVTSLGALCLFIALVAQLYLLLGGRDVEPGPGIGHGPRAGDHP